MKRSRQHRSTALVLLLPWWAVAFASTACEQAPTRPSSEPTVSAKTDPLMTEAGIERAIPIAFYKLYGTYPGALSNADLWADIRDSVWDANTMFKAMHVQFYPAVVKDCHGDGTLANVEGSNNTPQPYSAVADELRCAFPNLPAPTPAYAPWNQSHDKVWWVDYATVHY